MYLAAKHHTKTTEAQLLLGDIQIDNLYLKNPEYAEQSSFTSPDGRNFGNHAHAHQPKHQQVTKRQRTYYRKSDEEKSEEEFYDFTVEDEPQFNTKTRNHELFGSSDEESDIIVTSQISPDQISTFPTTTQSSTLPTNTSTTSTSTGFIPRQPGAGFNRPYGDTPIPVSSDDSDEWEDYYSDSDRSSQP